MSGALYVDGKKLCDIGELEFFRSRCDYPKQKKPSELRKSRRIPGISNKFSENLKFYMHA